LVGRPGAIEVHDRDDHHQRGCSHEGQDVAALAGRAANGMTIACSQNHTRTLGVPVAMQPPRIYSLICWSRQGPTKHNDGN